VLVGQRRALAIAIGGGQTRHRWSKLREWLDTQSLSRNAGEGGTRAAGAGG
jgi:hypothetical protein